MPLQAMEFYTLVSLVFLAILMWWYVVTRYNRTTAEPGTVLEFANYQLEELIQSEGINYYLIDVRAEEAYQRGHIPTAINIPARTCNGLLPTDDLFILVVVYGSNRKEAQNVAKILSEFGYFNVHVTNSITRWKGHIQEGDYQSFGVGRRPSPSYVSV
ncbi:rhodanese-like domain-containing protein [Candidatus Haliotispira prima]|uniref:Rhodanese-like domain-containing protein n=1 Tax=Candidatus Haliotispira prima TaxID=3034016 RepID=A0ABY8MJ60_9SPIO|nr:rhodanese-like domain-containing protein [Candidatus Haliotispira prima]